MDLNIDLDDVVKVVGVSVILAYTIKFFVDLTGLLF